MVDASIIAFRFEFLTPRSFHSVVKSTLFRISDAPEIVETPLIALSPVFLGPESLQAALKSALALTLEAPGVVHAPVKAFTGHLTILSISAKVYISNY